MVPSCGDLWEVVLITTAEKAGGPTSMRCVVPVVLLGWVFTPIAGAASYTAMILFPLSAPSPMGSASPSGDPGTSAGGQVVGSYFDTSDHATVWSAGGSAVDLSTSLSPGLVRSYAIATDGNQQAGYGEGSTGAGSDHALLWSGTASSVVDLNPVSLAGITASELYGLSANQQVGYGVGPGTLNSNHAMMWSGTAASAVDLNPTDLAISSSAAYATDGLQQVGLGVGAGTGNNDHALLWNGTAASAIDLNPTAPGFTISHAFGIDQNQEVGQAFYTIGGDTTHAFLWTGSAASAVDLNPTDLPGITNSSANATNGSQQVGYGFVGGGGDQALVWSGTANSAIDLQTMLPSTGTWTSSYASAIDSSGNVFGVAHGTVDNVTGYFGIEWSPTQSSSATDIGTKYLDLSGGSLSTLTAEVSQGFNGGNWNGTTGITSSAAAADSTHLTAVGIIQNNQNGSPIYSAANPFEGSAPGASDILVKYTYFGDTNLDGTVDGSDYTRIDSAYLADLSTPGSMTGWFNGDFNYDGVIDGSDYTLIDNAFNQQGTNIAAQIAVGTAQIADSPNASPVPEPAGISIATTSVALLAVRRRKWLASDDLQRSAGRG
jgi:hypothetical protein